MARFIQIVTITILMNNNTKGIILLIIITQIIQPVTVYGWEINLTSQVSSVVDGDTFRIPNDRIRLADIDAPEINEAGYQKATEILTSLVDGKTVYLDTDQKGGRDPNGRLIAVVYIKHNSTHYLNVNKELVLQNVVEAKDYADNDFHPSTWTRYVRYAGNAIPFLTIENFILVCFTAAILMASIYFFYFKLLNRGKLTG